MSFIMHEIQTLCDNCTSPLFPMDGYIYQNDCIAISRIQCIYRKVRIVKYSCQSTPIGNHL